MALSGSTLGVIWRFIPVKPKKLTPEKIAKLRANVAKRA